MVSVRYWAVKHAEAWHRRGGPLLAKRPRRDMMASPSCPIPHGFSAWDATAWMRVPYAVRSRRYARGIGLDPQRQPNGAAGKRARVLGIPGYRLPGEPVSPARAAL